MFINIYELGKPKRNVITQDLIDEWASEINQLSDLSENLTNKDDSENFLIASRELIKRIEKDIWVEQKLITRQKDQLKLLKEAKANLLEQITELQGEAL